ncbi:MAG: hypothetical protein K6C36_04340 [Clostridia bacterium]|nr:hypothetical protein [Clostridia bacterium]
MNRHFRFFAILWAVMLAVYNAVVFLAHPVIPGYVVRYDARFWLAWGFVIAAFIGNLVCAYVAFRSENLKKLFYRLPLITVSRAGLIATTVFGCAFMLIPDFPAWVTAIVCVLIFAIELIAVVKAKWAGDAVEAVDEKVKTKTAFIRGLSSDAEGLVARAKSDAVKAECKKVYEAVRCSDPVSDDALSVIEAKITVKTDEFSAAVAADDAEKAKEVADGLIALIGDRNRKCKELK